MRLSRNVLAALVITLPYCASAQQSNTQAPPVTSSHSTQTDAALLVYSHNIIDPKVTIGRPAAPLPATGNWSVAVSHEGPCVSIVAPMLCFAVSYHVPQNNVVCTWSVTADPDKGTEIIGEDRSAAHFFIRKVNPASAAALIKTSHPPEYPPLAKAAHVSGTVVVTILVDEQGKLISATTQTDHSMLGVAALYSVKGSVYLPLVSGGTPVRWSTQLAYLF